MNPVSYLLRLIYIQTVFAKHGLIELLLALPPLRRFYFVYRLLPWNWFSRSGFSAYSRGQRLRMMLQDLGPVYVKMGQTLSTRRDLLPEDVANELSLLCDEIPPFPSAKAKDILESIYRRPMQEVFAKFNSEVLASASIAQVHEATLNSGEQVIVKIVRPDLRRRINIDIATIHIVAVLMEKYLEGAGKMRPTKVVAEFHKTLLSELDMMREAANASQLRRNFATDDALHVPRIIWEYTHTQVLVMEKTGGIPIDDIKQLRAEGYDLREIAEKGVKLFFTQAFRDGFFHADMHSGNIFIGRNSSGGVQLRLVDFGIMSSLSDYDLRYLSSNLQAFLEHDYHQVALLHIESGWVPRHTRIDDFEFAIRTMSEPLLSRSAREISFGQLLLRLFQTARNFDMEILPQFLLLQKTLINVEGIGRYLYPDIDPWMLVKPMLEDWMEQRMGMRAIWRRVRNNAHLWVGDLPSLPQRIICAIDRGSDCTEEKVTNGSHIVLRCFRLLVGIGLCAVAVLLVLASTQGVDGPPAWQAFIMLGAGVLLLLKE
ncbi:MAG: 2-polyprenylphenol 6-hydroxylase [Candidatus Porifericomitaceae bacterium WSBS_2022_MAG_OTU9]